MGPPQPGIQLANWMLRLLSDPDPEVVRAAVRAVRRWNEREGTNFLFVPILICCAERRLKHDGEALAFCGEEALPLLVHFLRDRDEHFWVRLALPKTIARFRPEPARDALLGAAARRRHRARARHHRLRRRRCARASPGCAS